MKYNVQRYGAMPGGGLCTRQIQAAIDDCFVNGGGEVVVPESRCDPDGAFRSQMVL